MRRNLEIIFALLVGIVVGVASYGSYKSHDYHMTTQNPEPIREYIYIESEPEIIKEIEYVYIETEVPLERETEFVNLTFEEQELLEEIAMAEARSEGSVGMAYVMRVVLNRSLRDGMSIHDVIYAPNQFYTAGMMQGNEECHEALAMIMDGWDESQGACYFTAGGYGRYGEPLFHYKNHYFSK